MFQRLYKLKRKLRLNLRYLDPYHSHFILFDDGQMWSSTERQFKANLEANVLANLAKAETKMGEGKNINIDYFQQLMIFHI